MLTQVSFGLSFSGLHAYFFSSPLHAKRAVAFLGELLSLLFGQKIGRYWQRVADSDSSTADSNQELKSIEIYAHQCHSDYAEDLTEHAHWMVVQILGSLSFEDPLP